MTPISGLDLRHRGFDGAAVTLALLLVGWLVLWGANSIGREMAGSGECLWALAGRHHALSGLVRTRGATIQSWGLEAPIYYLDHPPLQGWYLSIWYSLFGWTAKVTRLASIAAWLAAALAVWYLTAAMGPGPYRAVLAAFLLVSAPATWAWGATDDLTSLNVALITIGFGLAAWWLQSPARRGRFALMVATFFLAALADWPGFVCLPALWIAARALNAQHVIERQLRWAALATVALFMLTAAYLEVVAPGGSGLLEAFVSRAGSGADGVAKAPLLWAFRAAAYLLPTVVIGAGWTLWRIVRSREERTTPSGLAILAFALANSVTFVLLRGWTGVMAQTILYWGPVCGVCAALGFSRWAFSSGPNRHAGSRRLAWIVIVQLLLASAGAWVVSVKTTSVAFEQDAGSWLRGRLAADQSLAVLVDHHGGDTNPVAFRYWAQRDVAAVTQDEIFSSSAHYFFASASVARKLLATGQFQPVGTYQSMAGPQGATAFLIDVYLRLFPQRRESFLLRSPYEGWVLVEAREQGA